MKKARYLNAHTYYIGKPHPVIRNASDSVNDVQKCLIKLQLITGSYILQAHRAKFNQFQVKPDCLLCGQAPENRTHFLVECPALQERRLPHLTAIKEILENNSDAETASDLCTDPETCTSLILDCTSDVITSRIPLPANCAIDIERISQKLVFTLHSARKNMLSLIAPSLARKRGKTNPKNAISLQQQKPQPAHLAVTTTQTNKPNQSS